VARGISTKTLGDLKRELGRLEGRLQEIEKRLGELNAPITKKHLVISAGLTAIGLATSLSGGPFGLIVGVASTGYGIREIAKYVGEKSKLKKLVKELEHDIALKANTIEQIKRRTDPPPN